MNSYIFQTHFLVWTDQSFFFLDASKAIRELRGVVKSTVTKDWSILKNNMKYIVSFRPKDGLVAGADAGSKLYQAESRGTEIWSEDQLLEHLNQGGEDEEDKDGDMEVEVKTTQCKRSRPAKHAKEEEPAKKKVIIIVACLLSNSISDLVLVMTGEKIGARACRGRGEPSFRTRSSCASLEE